MRRFLFVLAIAVSMWSVASCHKNQDRSKGVVWEPYIGDANSVPLDIFPVPSTDGSKQWLASYTSQGKVARFRFKIDPPTSSDSSPADSTQFDFGKGEFLSEPSSDASVLMADLEKALEAKHLPGHVARTSMLPFTYAILGKDQSQASGGGFNSTPPGNWTAMKIFIGSGSDEAEAFLNFNPMIRKAQFSEKDPDYGDMLPSQLAKVL